MRPQNTGMTSSTTSPNPVDTLGHGTHVSGIIAAQGDNGIGISGVSQRAALMELQVCGETSLPTSSTYEFGCPNSADVLAIDFAADHGARVLNGSLGGPDFDQATHDAIQVHPNLLFVFAAGNGGSDSVGDNNDALPTYPCSYDLPNVVCVAATDQADRLASFSNYGPQSVDLGAPGTNILSTSSFKTFFSEDFASGLNGWSNTPGSSWSTGSEAPLTSQGIIDSPGAPYPPNETNEVTSPAFTIPTGYSNCELDYFRSVKLGAGDHFTIEALLNGSAVTGANGEGHGTFDGPVDTTRNGSFSLTPAFDGGGQVQVRLRLTSDGDGSQADGVHMDDVALRCHGKPSDNTFYEYLQGTSMSAPMVTGATALLFSAKPAATVAEVKAALLDSVDPTPALFGKTVSCGRLDARRALERLLNPSPTTICPAPPGAGSSSAPIEATDTSRAKHPPNTSFAKKPARVVFARRKWVWLAFRFHASQRSATFVCQIDSGPTHRCGSKLVHAFSAGDHVVTVAARNSDGEADQTPAIYRFRVERIG